MPKLGILNTGKGFKPEKITHDHKCKNCGDPAKVNYQLVWVSWAINPDGEFYGMELHNTDDDEFWCSRCWNLDRNERYEELEAIRDAWNAILPKL